MGGATYIQGQIQTQHVALAQQLLESHICCVSGLALVLGSETCAIVVDDPHPERERGLARHVAPDAAHAEDPQRLAARVVALVGQGPLPLVVDAAPAPRAQAAEPDRQVPQGPQHEPNGQVRGRVVDGVRGVAHADPTRGAGRDVDAVISGAVVADVL